MTIANVALTHTFDTWRIRTNDTLTVVNGLQNGSGFANVASLKIQSLGTTGQFLKIANSATGLIGASGVSLGFSDLTGTISGSQFPPTITIAANTTFSGTTKTMGAVGTVKITGGTSGQTILTDGSGNLSFGYQTIPDGTVTWAKLATSGVYSTDATLAANSAVLVATQSATKTYVDTQLTTKISTSAIGSTVQRYNANTAITSNASTWTKPQTPGTQTLTDAATVAIAITAPVWTLTTTASRVIGAPTGGVAHTRYSLELTSGGFTPSWNTVFKFPGGTVPSSLTGFCVFDFLFDGTNYNCVGQSVGEA